MLKSNAEKEVLYIFLWLIGIIFFYGLVHTFILEPTNEKSHGTHESLINSEGHNSHPLNNTVTSINTKVKKVSDNDNTVPNTINKVSILPVVSTPIEVTKVPEVTKAISHEGRNTTVKNSTKQEIENQNTTKEKKGKWLYHSFFPQFKIPTVPEVSTVTAVNSVMTDTNNIPTSSSSQTDSGISIPTVPSLPSVPSVPSIPSVTHKVKPVTDTFTQKLKIKTPLEKATESLEKEVNMGENMKLLDTAREHVRAEAEAARQKAIDALSN